MGSEGVLVLGGGPPSADTIPHATLHTWPAVKRLSYATHRLSVTVRGVDKSTKIKFNLQENR